MAPKIIKLSPVEIKIARYIGELRRIISLWNNRQTRHDFTPDGPRNDIEAVAAEMAVAKYLNVYPDWSPTKGEVPKFDLQWQGKRVDVKSTRHPNGNLLIPDLNKNLIYFLVQIQLPQFLLIGKIDGFKVNTVGEWVDMPYRPCWVVKSDLLEGLN